MEAALFLPAVRAEGAVSISKIIKKRPTRTEKLAETGVGVGMRTADGFVSGVDDGAVALTLGCPVALGSVGCVLGFSPFGFLSPPSTVPSAQLVDIFLVSFHIYIYIYIFKAPLRLRIHGWNETDRYDVYN